MRKPQNWSRCRTCFGIKVCHGIVISANLRLNNANFFPTFDAAQKELAAFWKWERSFDQRDIDEIKDSLLAQNPAKHVLKCGQAIGKAKSKPRLAQLEALWDQNIPGLHTHLPHTDDPRQKREWITKCAEAPRDMFFRAWILGQCVPETLSLELQSVLEVYGPRASDTPGRTRAFNRYCIDYSRRYSSPSDAHIMDKYVSTGKMDGSMIQINTDRLATIK